MWCTAGNRTVSKRDGNKKIPRSLIIIYYGRLYSSYALVSFFPSSPAIVLFYCYRRALLVSPRMAMFGPTTNVYVPSSRCLAGNRESAVRMVVYKSVYRAIVVG